MVKSLILDLRWTDARTDMISTSCFLYLCHKECLRTQHFTEVMGVGDCNGLMDMCWRLMLQYVASVQLNVN